MPRPHSNTSGFLRKQPSLRENMITVRVVSHNFIFRFESKMKIDQIRNFNDPLMANLWFLSMLLSVYTNGPS